MRRLLACALLASISASGAGAAPGDQIGATVRVVNLVTAAYQSDNRTLATGDGVRQQELIGVGDDSLGEIKFVDETKLALGPGSKLVLDKFVYDPDKTKGSIAINLVKGAFRFITGVADKPTYVIKTPTAAITVRGTIFDLYVQGSGMTWLLLHEGAIRICNTRGKCREHDEPGKLIRVTDTGEVGIPVRWTGLPGSGAVPFDTAFPFVVAPPMIDPAPLFTRDAILTDEPADQPRKPRRAETPQEPDKPGKPPRGTRKAEETKTPEVKKPEVKKSEAKKPDKPVREAKPAGGKVTEGKPKKPRTQYVDDGVDIKTGMDIAIGLSGGIKIGGGGKNRGGGTKYPNGSGGRSNPPPTKTMKPSAPPKMTTKKPMDF